MKHTLTPQQYLTLFTVMITAAVGDTLLSHGMSQVGAIDRDHLSRLLTGLENPWVISGILCLIGFFATYLTALSWADLTFVLPSTAFGYVVVAFLGHFWLHEHISVWRWTGILLIVSGVGFVANGPALTEHPEALAEESVLRDKSLIKERSENSSPAVATAAVAGAAAVSGATIAGTTIQKSAVKS